MPLKHLTRRQQGIIVCLESTQGKALMLTDEQGVQLHHRSVRGEPLTADEKAALEAWPHHQDEIESTQLGLHLPQTDLAQLRTEIDAALSQLIAKTQRMQQLERENEMLRQEIASLRHRLERTLEPALA
jgi:peptidoglycan hydrolase CwlO-like protein